jgi:hypothetical protein
LATVGPFLAFLNKGVRESGTALRWIGASIVFGIALHIVWLIVPSFGLASLAPAALGIIFVAALLAMWLGTRGVRWVEYATSNSGAVAHG